MKTQLHNINKTYALAVWILGISTLLWSAWLSFQYVNKAMLNPPMAGIGGVNARQHKLNNAAYDRVLTTWNDKIEQAKIVTPLINPFANRP